MSRAEDGVPAVTPLRPLVFLLPVEAVESEGDPQASLAGVLGPDPFLDMMLEVDQWIQQHLQFTVTQL